MLKGLANEDRLLLGGMCSGHYMPFSGSQASGEVE